MLIGTIASPGILTASHRERRELIARMLDKGIDHVFIADHVSFINGLGMDGLINAATLTAIDERLKVVVGVYLLALRHPVVVARQLATLAESAPGQLLLGVGVGGEDRNEIAMCGVDPATRGRRTDECLTVLAGLAGGNSFSFDGEFFSFEGARIVPAPDPAIPVLIGGRVDASLERAARFGDGWLAVWVSPERFARATATVEARAAELDRTKPALHGLQLWAGIDRDRDRARARLAKGMENFYHVPFARFEKYSPYGTAAEVADFLARYRDAGCELFNIMPIAEDDAAGIDAVAEIAERLR
ncbi:MAG: LLM class flavin-dependent oxidoreductase [Pseudomonadales bacterium]|jgi:alkanesulfonate monooxygenase SsuD/methylene tetrahydromethanopterin reductase-like flavin-dependent oxidoreductase (luciferase family)